MNRFAVALAAAALATGCTEYSYTSRTNKDVFQQVRRTTVDVLMVVDNSCSMVEEQDKLASNFDEFIGAFEGVDVDWQMAVVTTDMYDEEFQGRFLGGEDEIELQTSGGRTIDRISFDEDWPYDEGASVQLDIASYSASANDSVDNWCLSRTALSSGDLGSPGEENASCSAAAAPPAEPEDTGASDDTAMADDTAVADDTGASGLDGPSAGDVIITEYMPDPAAVADDVGEWVELTNLTGSDLDLSGYALVDDGRNSFTFPDGAIISGGAALVVGRSASTGANGGISVDIEAGDDLTLNNQQRLLNHETEGAREIFSEMVAVGTSGSGIEMGLEAARAALSEPLLSDRNDGFLRDEASLSLIFVSDENDYSGLDVNDYLRHFKDLKGDAAYRDNGMVNVSAVVGRDEPEYEGLPSCESADGLAAWGVRYVDLANRTEGALESICDEDFSPIAHELGLTVSGLEVEFELSEPADENTLSVKLYESPSESDFLGELKKDEDYTYVVETNSIRFEASQVPASEVYIVAEYRVLAEGASNATERVRDVVTGVVGRLLGEGSP